MRRFVFALVVVLLLLGSIPAMALEKPKAGDGVVQLPSFPVLLGDFIIFNVDGYFPYERVDGFLYRPSTLAGWPLEFPWDLAGGPNFGTAFAEYPASLLRRQTWPRDQFADPAGVYSGFFMMPRDEAWYPCSFPLKWKCGDHSMVDQTQFEPPLVWPWLFNPQDVVHPVEIWFIGASGWYWVAPVEVTGMYWLISDIF